MEVLCQGYRVPFHHFPPVYREPWEFPLYALGSVRALALQEEISTMLQKGTLELVDQPGLGFYSCFFLVQKLTGGWRPVINLSTLNVNVTLPSSDGDSGIGRGVN